MAAATATLKRRALAATGSVARYVPAERAQLFAFVASPAVRASPWPLYRRLHQRGPVRPAPYGAWLIASHAGVSQVLRHPATSVDESVGIGQDLVDRTGPFAAVMGRSLLFTDPPDHARLRRLVSRAFTPRTVEALRPRVEALAEGMVTRLRPAGSAVTLAALLLVAGFETTANLVGNGLLALLHHPEQLALVRDGEADPAVAVEELLRYDGPVQFTQRVLLEDLEVGGHPIAARTLVALFIGAANRDPLVFSDPDRLDVARTPNPHLAFSSGIHHCLGAALARLEAAVAVPAVLRSLPCLQLARRPRWRDTFVLRGLRSLPVAWRP